MTPTDHDLSTARVTSGSAHSPKGLLRRVGVVPALILVAFALGGCELPTFGGFRGVTKQGQTESTLWSQMVTLGVIVAVIVWGLIFWAIIRYRRRDNNHIPRQFHENIPIEIIYTVIPLILVGVIFYGTVIAENKIDAVSSKPAEIINVTGFRWGWRFTYEDSTGASQHVLVQTASEPKLLAQPATSSEYPQIVLPLNSTVRIVLQSTDVVHGFYIPEFNFSRYAQPGVINTFDFTTTNVGVFRGQCSQYCGLYHAEMLFSVKVEPQREFSQWLTSNRT